MLQAKCKTKCSYGEKGEVVKLDQKELTKRQSVMLELYEAPKVKDLTGGDDNSESEADKQLKALMKKNKDELLTILIEAEVEHDQDAKKEDLAKLIIEKVEITLE